MAQKGMNIKIKCADTNEINSTDRNDCQYLQKVAQRGS